MRISLRHREADAVKEFMGKTIKKGAWINVAKSILIVPIALCMCVAVTMCLTKTDAALLGYRSFIVLTGSMSPAINAGSYIIAREKNPEDILIGDILTYKVDSGAVLTHRVVEIINDGGYSFITKGDANNVPDKNPVTADKIIGVVVFRVAGLGKLLIALKQPEILITLGMLMIAGFFSAAMLKGLVKKESGKR